MDIRVLSGSDLMLEHALGGNPASVRPASMPEVVYEQLREEILAGRFRPGEKIPQEEVAKRFGFSRVPVREALRRLESEGLVLLRPQRGYVVASLDLAQIEEIFDIRMMLEERAGYLATLARTPEDVAAVEAILDAMAQMPVRSVEDIPAWSAYNLKFHSRLFLSSRRMHLCRLAATLRDSVEPYIRIDAANSGRIEAADVDHAAMLDAFREGNAERVAALSREHCESTCASVLESLRKQQS